MTEFPLQLAAWLRPLIVADLAKRHDTGDYVITDADILREFQRFSVVSGVPAPTAIEWVGDWHG